MIYYKIILRLTFILFIKSGITNTNETDVLIGATTHGDGISLEVERKIVHKKYNPRNHKNDIALIKVQYVYI